MVEWSAAHHLLTDLSSAFHTSPRQVTSFTTSARNTAVVEMNMSPGLVVVVLVVEFVVIVVVLVLMLELVVIVMWWWWGLW